ncbi:MAG: Xaa-Pro peptidase family protein [Mariprofundaceae bacterium]
MQAKLLISASEYDADMLYISKMFVPDPFIAIGIDLLWHGLFSPLEVGRARTHSDFDHIHLDTTWRDIAEKESGERPCLAHVAAAFLNHHQVTELIVPATFPTVYSDRLRALGFEVKACDQSLFPQRIVKLDKEIAQLSKAEKLTRASMRQAEHFLSESTIGNDGILRHPNHPGRVKSHHLRAEIDAFLIRKGAVPSHTIVACGKESADPHQVGQGYLRAHQPIIIDIFPRLMATGYWGDMTRTYVKGKAAPTLKKMYQTVREGQDIGLGMVANGVDGSDIHSAITHHFDASGFPTKVIRGRQTGFFHGTGHGVGLDIHESPRISKQGDTLASNHVVTVEPGLYYPSIGGVRLEDLVVVQENGCLNLTNHPRKLEIA